MVGNLSFVRLNASFGGPVDSYLSNFFYISQQVLSPGNSVTCKKSTNLDLGESFCLDPTAHLDDVVVETVVELAVDAHHGVVEEQPVLKNRET